MRVKRIYKIHSSGWLPNDATIRTIDSLGHSIKIKGIDAIRYLMVMGIPNKGRIVDHQSRVSKFPVVPLVHGGGWRGCFDGTCWRCFGWHRRWMGLGLERLIQQFSDPYPSITGPKQKKRSTAQNTTKKAFVCLENPLIGKQLLRFDYRPRSLFCIENELFWHLK